MPGFMRAWRLYAVISGVCIVVGIVVGVLGHPYITVVLSAFSVGVNIGWLLGWSRGMDRGIDMVHHVHDTLDRRREKAPLN